jgi:hypothetical protein
VDNTIKITTLLPDRSGPYGSYDGGSSSVHGGVCFSVPLCTVGVPCFPGDVLFICFYVNRALSLLIMKIPPKKPLDGVAELRTRSGTVSVIVSVEPLDSVAGSCSKIGSKESSSSWRICTMLMVGADWAALGRTSSVVHQGLLI